MHTWAAIPCSPSRMRPSQPRPGVRLSPSPCLNMLPTLFYCIKQAKNNLSAEAMKSLYYALVHSHLTYCPIILSCTNITNINRIIKVQKKAICIITNSTYNEHTTPLFKNLGILRFDKLTEVGSGAFFALSRSRARRQNKSAKARRKKSESAERERKKARICAFSPTHSGYLV